VKTLKTSLAIIIFAFCAMQVNAVTHENYLHEAPSVFNHNDPLPGTLLLADNTEESLYGAQPEEPNSNVRSGDLIIPSAKATEAKEKQCVTVCDTWGENCVINPRTGTRKCRRICKAFGKECI